MWVFSGAVPQPPRVTEPLRACPRLQRGPRERSHCRTAAASQASVMPRAPLLSSPSLKALAGRPVHGLRWCWALTPRVLAVPELMCPFTAHQLLRRLPDPVCSLESSTCHTECRLCGQSCVVCRWPGVLRSCGCKDAWVRGAVLSDPLCRGMSVTSQTRRD